MSDKDGKTPLGLGGGNRPGAVKQSFSHGRTKSVVVETKRKRVVVPKAAAPMTDAQKEKNPLTARVAGDSSKRPAGISDAEMERRLKALAAAKAREADDAAFRRSIVCPAHQSSTALRGNGGDVDDRTTSGIDHRRDSDQGPCRLPLLRHHE